MHLDTLGDYSLQRLLGSGAFGDVYLAEHRFIKKPYALKVLPETLCRDGAFLRRFEEDVHSVAQLDHPNIVKIYNVTCADGRYFLVMDPIVDSYGETMHLERFDTPVNILVRDRRQLLERVMSLEAELGERRQRADDEAARARHTRTRALLRRLAEIAIGAMLDAVGEEVGVGRQILYQEPDSDYRCRILNTIRRDETSVKESP